MAKIEPLAPIKSDKKEIRKLGNTAVLAPKKNSAKYLFKLICGTDKDPAAFFIEDLVVPVLRSTIVRAFGGSAPSVASTVTSSIGGVSRVNFSSISTGKAISTASHSLVYDDVYLVSEESVKEFRESLQEVLDIYDKIEVFDFHDIAQRPTTPEERNFGWRSLAGMEVVEVKHPGSPTGIAYWVKMPRPSALK